MAQPTVRNHAHRGNHKQYAQMTHSTPQSHVVHATVLTQSKHVPINAVPINVVRPVRTVVPKLKVTRQRHDKPIVTKPNSPTRMHISRNPYPKSSNSPPRVTVVQALMVNATQGLQVKWESKPKCPILDHVSRNTSASMTLKRFDYNDALGRSKVINSGCSTHMIGNMSYLSDFEELNGGYVAFGGNPKGEKAREEIEQQYVLFPVWSSGSTNPQNNDGDVVLDEMEPKFDEKKPESEVNVSPSSSAQSKKHDDKTKIEAKVPTLGQISPNNTNTFSDAAPLDAAARPTHR
nr:hypothetical protein [Tanacetum cinerariifolium]